MLTYEDLRDSPESVRDARHGCVFTLKCSRPSCSTQLQMPRGRVMDKIRTGVKHTYCSSLCRGQHRVEKTIVIQDEVDGRICKDCGDWTPLTKMNRGHVCRPCYKKQPKVAFSMSRSQAQFAGNEWLLDLQEFMQFWDQPCLYCGDPIKGVRLDRVDPSKEYRVSNVVSCCWPCNRGKGDGSVEDFLERCLRVARTTFENNGRARREVACLNLIGGSFCSLLSRYW